MVVESDDEDDAIKTPTGQHGLGCSGPYFLQSMIDDVPLLADQTVKDVEITCVELWGEYGLSAISHGALGII
jgi:hypothetical protein